MTVAAAQAALALAERQARGAGGGEFPDINSTQASNEVVRARRLLQVAQQRQASAPRSTASSGGGGGGGSSAANAGLAGTEFRTPEQTRAEAELAKQLGVDSLSEVKPPEKLTAELMERPDITPGANEFLDTTGKLLGENREAVVSTAAPGQVVSEAPTLAAPQGVATTVAGQEKEMTAASLAAPTVEIDPNAIEGTVTAPSLATAQTEELDERATLTFQLEQLFKGFKPGETPPAWATPLIRRSAARSLASGIGASSMAAAATVQAIIEAGIPLAREDAQRFATLQVQNLSNKHQTALANAAVFAAMDQTNVGVRLNANIENAKNFLAIDTANLNNAQQEEVLNQQARNQFLLSDQAATNSMENLNVTTEMQTDHFFSQLGVQVREANANRTTAVEQFNSGQRNTIEVFNSKQQDLRERFNAEQTTAIAATNADHRRRITLQNAANQMVVNEVNAREINGLNVREYQEQYLNYRDAATRIFATAESNENRAVQLAEAELQASAIRSSGGGGGSSTGSSLISGIATVASAFIA